MTTTVIYTCDICQQPQKGRHENGGFPPLWTVTIGCRPIDHQSQYHGTIHEQGAEMCTECLDRLGIRKPLLRAEGEQKAPTLEDMIRAIVREAQQEGE